MKCPVCDDSQLLMTERQGVEIDYCPSCRGVWLDRGELDTILERSAGGPTEGRQEPGDHGHETPHDEKRKRHDSRDPRRQKRGGFLSDLLGGFGGD
jgi:uncharacterized protein